MARLVQTNVGYLVVACAPLCFVKRIKKKKLCQRNHLDSLIPPVLGFLSDWMNQ